MHPIQLFQPIVQHIMHARVEANPYLLAVSMVGLAGLCFRAMRLRDKFKNASATDALTGIANRRGLTEKIGEIFKKSKSENLLEDIAVVSIDLNGFKKINDEYGHDAGDLALRHFVKGLYGCVKLQKDFIARPGGDEFVVLMQSSNAAESATKLMTRLTQELEKNLLRIDDKGKKLLIEVKFSYGVKVFTAVDLNSGKIKPENFLAESDEKMYEQKQRKLNSCVHQPS